MNEREYIKKRKAAKPLSPQNLPPQPVVVSNRPVPVEARGGLRKFDHFYPFEQMQVGDSFWVNSVGKSVRSVATRFGQKAGWKFTARGQTHDGRANARVSGSQSTKRGTRVWRIG